jgi:haloalkane dehalogenase
VSAELASVEGIAYREAGRAEGPAVLLLHGYPQSSYMWRHALPVVAAAGMRAIAPDLPGFGDSPPDPPGTWERHVDALERFHSALDLGAVVLVVHDWGGLIGLRWACEHPRSVRALVLSDTGFFPDGKWHGMAKAMRTEGTGEELVGQLGRDGFAAVLRQGSEGIDDEAIDEYWKCFADADRRRGQLELYRSGDFEKLAAYEGRLAALGVPALALWGADDPFAPAAGAYRFQRELPDARVAIVEGAGHFVWEDDPARCGAELRAFLDSL